MVFFRCWSFVLLMAAAAAVREESKLSLDLATEEYMEEEMEMKLVPARISKAIRRTMRLSKEATAVAAAKEAAEAEKKSEESDKAMEEATKKRQVAEQKQKAANEAMKTNDASQKAWEEGVAKLDGLVAKHKDLDEKYLVLTAQLKKEMMEIANKKLAAYQELEAAKSEKEKEASRPCGSVGEGRGCQGQYCNGKDGKCRSSKGGTETSGRSSPRIFLETTSKPLNIEEDLSNAAQTAAADAAEAVEEARLRAKRSEEKFLDAKSAKERKAAVASLIKEVRDSVQAFYDAMDKSSKSMEKLYDESEGNPEAKPAHEHLRTNPDVKAALVAYNEMVLVFRQLHVTSKDFYTYIADSVGEIQQNAEAAIQLQCDPTEELERKAKETKNLDEWHQNCGKGVWKDLKIEQQRFPHLEKNKAKAETDQ